MTDLITILERMPDECSLEIRKSNIMGCSYYKADILYRSKVLARADNLISDPQKLIPWLEQDLNISIKDALSKLEE